MPATLAPTTRIRFSVFPEEPPAVAEVLAQRGDSLWVRTPGSVDTTLIALPTLSRLDISRGLKGHPVKGAVIGLLSGAVLGAVVGASIGSDCQPDPYPGVHFDCLFPRNETALIMGAELAGVGTAAGLIIGSLVRAERWESASFTKRGSIALWRGEGARTYGVRFRYPIM